jgi:hypothetical protein
MDWPSQYHAILGEPEFLRFMAVPHYTYLVLKLPGQNGIITVKGNFDLSDTCDKVFHKMAQTFGMTAEYTKLKGDAERGTLLEAGRSPPDKALDDMPDAKKIRVHPSNLDKVTSIKS